MGLDIRLPIGLFFSIIGCLLTGFGLLADKGIYQKSLGINLNLVWGIALLVAGLAMLLLAQRGSKRKANDVGATTRVKSASEQV